MKPIAQRILPVSIETVKRREAWLYWSWKGRFNWSISCYAERQ